MEALALTLIIGTALLLAGVKYGGLVRWLFAALGLSLLLISLNRISTQYPDFFNLSIDPSDENVTRFIRIGLGLLGSLGVFLSGLVYIKTNKTVERIQESLVKNSKGRSGRRLKETIITLKLLSEEIKIAILTTFFSVVFATVCTGISSLFNFKLEVDAYTFWLIVVLIITLSWLRVALLNYRIFRGYYGNNLYEAKEVISFIERISDNLPPSDHGGQIKAFPGVESNEDALWVDGLTGEGNQ